jgi:uncharacterized membrane protein YoaK (UPF0700 family)
VSVTPPADHASAGNRGPKAARPIIIGDQQAHGRECASLDNSSGIWALARLSDSVQLMTQPNESDSGPTPGRFRRALVDDLDGPLPALLLALTVLAGIVDATSILRLGHVFCATVTGNLVFLGLAGAGVTGFDVATPAVALGGFVIGALVGGHACRVAGSHRGLAVRNVLAIKALLATVVTLGAFITGGEFSLGVQDVLLVLLAISMGTQLALIRFLKVPDLVTVSLTFTITGALIERGKGWDDPAVLRRGLAMVAFAAGAMVGALLIRLLTMGAATSLSLAIIVVAGVAAHRVSRDSSDWALPR